VNTLDPHLIVRAASLYVALMLTSCVWLWRRPTPRAWTAGLLASLWNVPIVLALNVTAAAVGWWWFDAQGGLLLGVPVDLLLAWAWLWGAVAVLAFPSMPLPALVCLAFAVDLVLMPVAAPVVRLGPTWITGETVGLAVGLTPGVLLARWTVRNKNLVGRAILQMIAFAGLTLFLMPAMAIEASGGRWFNPFARPLWQINLMLQALALAGLFGLTAVQEFVMRGDGTPVPFDPPKRLVTSGIYAYLRNPMQLSGVLMLMVLGIVLRNVWVSTIGVMAHIYSMGLAGWDEEEDLRLRFSNEWTDYRRNVRRWVPRTRPWFSAAARPSKLFISGTCGMCRQVAEWFSGRDVRGLEIIQAETHRSRRLRRMTYEPADGSRAVEGIEAFARAIEHLHFGWALLGFILRLPLVCSLAQLLADASGAGPRAIAHESFDEVPYSTAVRDVTRRGSERDVTCQTDSIPPLVLK
jgi:protein-S-isoprenylcysteine O-methyltransferase Ste14